MIDSLDIDELIIMKKKQMHLDKHPYAIWQSKDGKYWYTTLPDSSKNRGIKQIRRSSKQELEKVIIEYWEQHNNDKTVLDIFTEWNDNRIKMNKVSQATYININAIYKRCFSGMSDRVMNDIKPIEWCDFLENAIVEFNLTSDIFVKVKSIVMNTIKWAYRHNYIQYSSSSISDMLEISSKSFKNNKKEDEEEVYSEAETVLLVNYLMDNKDDLINLGLLLMFVTGIRSGELITLKHKDFVGNILKIRRTRTSIITETGKIGRGVQDSPKTSAGSRDIVVHSDFRWLMDYFANGNPDDYIFVSKFGNILREDSVCKRLKKACKAVNIPYRSPHKIRKTYITILIDNGVDSRFVISQSGHANISCAEDYYHKNRKSEARKAEIIDAIPDFKKLNGNIT